MVYFVGAGPGAEDLITVRGMRLLGQADLVVYAGSLVNPRLLDYTKESCEIYDSAGMTLGEVVAVMQEGARDGKLVVRLHTGDPSVYGAVREQMDELERLGRLAVLDHHADGGAHESPAKRKHRGICGASGVHGRLSERGSDGGAGQAADRRRVRRGFPGGDRV